MDKLKEFLERVEKAENELCAIERMAHWFHEDAIKDQKRIHDLEDELEKLLESMHQEDEKVAELKAGLCDQCKANWRMRQMRN